MSIRLRMTLLYSIILALTLIAFSGILYAAQARQTMDIVKNDLVMSANRIIPLLIYAERSLDRARPAMPGIAMPPRLELREVRTRDTVRLLDANGMPFDLPINEGSEELPLSQKGLARLRDGEPWIEIAHSQEGRVLTYDLPVVRDGEVVAIIQVGRSLADRDRSLQALGLTLILGSLLTALVAFGAGWLLAGVTLRPIQRITQTALEIGQTRDFSSRVPYRGPNDELGRLATTFNGMLARLADAYQQVTHALQVQRDFVADVSHELRTPLTTIRGNLALLHREPPIPGAEQEDILGDLIGESERLIRLVNDLLILARADAGRKLQCEPVAVGPLVDDVCRQAQLLEPGREIACDGSGDAVALADRDALKQVLLILLDNAVQHTGGGHSGGRASPCEHVRRERVRRLAWRTGPPGHDQRAGQRAGHIARVVRARFRPLLPGRRVPFDARFWPGAVDRQGVGRGAAGYDHSREPGRAREHVHGMYSQACPTIACGRNRVLASKLART